MNYLPDLLQPTAYRYVDVCGGPSPLSFAVPPVLPQWNSSPVIWTTTINSTYNTLTHSLTHSLTHPPTHSLTHSLARAHRQRQRHRHTHTHTEIRVHRCALSLSSPSPSPSPSYFPPTAIIPPDRQSWSRGVRACVEAELFYRTGFLLLRGAGDPTVQIHWIRRERLTPNPTTPKRCCWNDATHQIPPTTVDIPARLPSIPSTWWVGPDITSLDFLRL